MAQMNPHTDTFAPMNNVYRTSVLCSALLIACSDSSGPGSLEGARLAIIAGANVTDTVTTIPTQGLVVRLRRPDGSADAGVEVRFEAPTQSRMLVSGVSQTAFGTLATATTDAAGRATVRVQLGSRAGDGWIGVNVPLYALTDTARYTVLPGAAVRVLLSPRDTALSPGGSFTYRGSTVDRFNNARNDAATFEVATGTSVRVTGAGLVTAQGFGISRVRVRATVGSTAVTDSGAVSVVPTGQIAWSASPFAGALILGELNGSSSRTLVNNGLAASWEPGGNRLVFTRSGLFIVDLNGIETRLTTPGVENATWPEWSADGQWIYFHGSSFRVMRIRPDGSGIEAASTVSPSVGSGHATPSPDGRSVAYTENGRLVVFDLTARTARSIVNSAAYPRWSPSGEWIAYLQNGRPFLIRPDGTGGRQITDRSISEGYNWSPDSKWIVAQGTLLDVETGIAASLPWIGAYPTWRR